MELNKGYEIRLLLGAVKRTFTFVPKHLRKLDKIKSNILETSAR